MNFVFVSAAGLLGLLAVFFAVRFFLRGRRAISIPLVYFAVIAFTWVAMTLRTGGYRPGSPPDPSAGTRPTEEAMHGYVSSDTCRSCHPGEYHSWHASYHRTMTQIATEETVRGDFDSGFTGESPGMNVRMSRDEEGFWATYSFLRPDGEGVRKIARRKVVMTTGSHHYQVYWTDASWEKTEAEGDRSVWLVPYVYLFDEQQWISRQASFLTPPRDISITATWNQGCIRCHSTHGITKGDSSGGFLDTRTVELGISCEACHGPGKEHVEANRDPLRRYRLHRKGEGDPTIVNPARLDHERSSETCGQCHSVFVPPDTTAANRWRENGIDYRPGEDLDDSHLIVHPGRAEAPFFEKHVPRFFENRFWSDGMIRVAGREYHGLLNTPCFQRGEMSCLTCHSMHKTADDSRTDPGWADDQLFPGMRGNAACLQCHESFSEPARLTQHTHHSAESSGSNCYNCHMPHTTYGLHKGIRSHQINSPTVQASLDTGRPNACNLCHLDQTLGWTAARLSEWFDQPKPELTGDQRTVAAGLLWLLKGDAGQRALVASAMGREETREASGSDWMAPFLAQLHLDPYAAVQIIANKALREIEGFANLPRYPETKAASEQAYRIWKENPGQRRNEPALLLNGEGKIDQSAMIRMLEMRDDTPVNLSE